MSSLPKLIGISGSLRAGSFSTAVLEGLKDALAGKAELLVFRLNDVPLYNGDLDNATPPAGVTALREAIKAADGAIVATPEYNYATSGVLKNAIDWASRPYGQSAFAAKPSLIVSSSPGVTGGVRAQHQVRDALSAAGARVVSYPHVAIAEVQKKVTDGKLTDKAALDFTLGAIDVLLTEIRLVETLKKAA
ncbi:NADPH-dependent FMN reductase [Ancylobacter terrae]|uniref:NADPH-dependent FMN reductase n=1 Tax=Ancylobacter sp. sgz301288 TaxID=3342077 RepID=UPI00385AD34C